MAGACTAAAQEAPRPLESVAYRVDVTAGAPRTAASSTTLRSELFSHLFLASPGDVLRGVPGLVIAQHGGGGKADQYLIRGVDADHGTDVHVSVDAIPVNMVSHAHGQGYADLHFVISETIDRIEVYKGPYYPQFGNLATAGAIQLVTRDRFDRPFFLLQGGSFGTGRAAFGVSPAQAPAWLAGEIVVTDGPFRHPQDFSRLNIAGKWRSAMRPDQALTLSAAGYRAGWNASGQVPARLVASGRFDRFDAIDPSEGGETARAHASADYEARIGSRRVSAQAYVVDYSLDLFSNFTFFARDPERGDGILQRDRRSVWGGRAAIVNPHMLGRVPAVATVGTDWRRDGIDVSLLYQQQRRPAATVTDSQIHEHDFGLYLQEEIIVSDRVRAITGVRHDRFAFDVAAKNRGPAGTESAAISAPKASVILTPTGNPDFQLFANYGRGFHSNDARAVVSDPTAPVLPASNGYEVGTRRTLGRRAELSATWWLLDLESEFRWIGDEGVTEAAGATRRQGIEIEARSRLTDTLWAEVDMTASRGRYRDTGDAIARAPRFTLNAATTRLPKIGRSTRPGSPSPTCTSVESLRHDWTRSSRSRTSSTWRTARRRRCLPRGSQANRPPWTTSTSRPATRVRSAWDSSTASNHETRGF